MARASTIALAALLFAGTHAAAVAQSIGANNVAPSMGANNIAQQAGGAVAGQAAAQPYYYQDPGQYATGEGGGYAIEYVDGESAAGQYDPANVFQGEDGQYYYYEYVDEGEAAGGEYVEQYPAANQTGVDGQAYYVEEAAADSATQPYDPANVFQGPDGQYYYYEYEDVPAGEETYDAAAEQSAYAYPPGATYAAPQYNTPASTINYLVPGADWSHNAQAAFQADEVVPRCPAKKRSTFRRRVWIAKSHPSAGSRKKPIKRSSKPRRCSSCGPNRCCWTRASGKLTLVFNTRSLKVSCCCHNWSASRLINRRSFPQFACGSGFCSRRLNCVTV